MCFGVFMLAPSFVTLWIGSEYVMDTLTLLLMTAILFIQLSRTTVDAYINAYGLFGDICPVVEASINVGLSILLGYFFGLHGIFVRGIDKPVSCHFCWKPWLLFRKGLKQPVFSYIYMYVKHLLVAIISSFFSITYQSVYHLIRKEEFFHSFLWIVYNNFFHSISCIDIVLY